MSSRAFQVLVYIAALISGCTAQLTTCSARSNGVSYLPNIEASQANELENTMPTGQNTIYIIPMSSLHCNNGTVTGVEYCYRQYIPSSGTTFKILILSRIATTFTVDSQITVSASALSPTQCSRTNIINCCGTHTFSEKFDLPQGDFYLGVLTQDSINVIITYDPLKEVYLAPTYQAAVIGDLDLNSIIVAGSQVMLPLRVMRLIVGDSVDPNTLPPMDSAGPKIDTPMSTKKTITGTNHSMGGMSPLPAVDGGIVPVFVGVSVGLSVAVVLIVIMCGGVVIVLVGKKKRTKRLVTSDGNQTVEHYSDSNSSTLEEGPLYETVAACNASTLTADLAIHETDHSPMYLYETIFDTPAISQNKPVCVLSDSTSQDCGYDSQGMNGVKMTQCEAYGTGIDVRTELTQCEAYGSMDGLNIQKETTYEEFKN